MQKLNVTDRQTDGRMDERTDGRTGDVAISPVPGPTTRREIMIVVDTTQVINFNSNPPPPPPPKQTTPSRCWSTFTTQCSSLFSAITSPEADCQRVQYKKLPMLFFFKTNRPVGEVSVPTRLIYIDITTCGRAVYSVHGPRCLSNQQQRAHISIARSHLHSGVATLETSFDIYIYQYLSPQRSPCRVSNRISWSGIFVSILLSQMSINAAKGAHYRLLCSIY